MVEQLKFNMSVRMVSGLKLGGGFWLEYMDGEVDKQKM